MRRAFYLALFCTIVLVLPGCTAEPTQPVQGEVPSEYYSLFKPDGKGGLLFSNGSFLREQAGYSGVKNLLIEGQLKYPEHKSDIYVAVHYPSGIHPVVDDFAEKRAISLTQAILQNISRAYTVFLEASPDGKVLCPFQSTYTLADTGHAVTLVFRDWFMASDKVILSELEAVSFEKETGRMLSLMDIFHTTDSLDATFAWLKNHDGGKDSALMEGIYLDDLRMEQLELTPDGLSFYPISKNKAMTDWTEPSVKIPLEVFDDLGISTKFWGRSPSSTGKRG